MIDVLMPVITEKGEDSVVTAWFVGDGNRVAEGQLIAEVQAEKVAEEVHAPSDGVVRNLVAINEPVPQGGPICVIVSAEAEEGAAVPSTAAAPPSSPTDVEPRIAASPAARRVAGELGVDLAAVAATGPGGRITEGDVRAAAAVSAPAGVPLSGLRATIARNMRSSHAETAAVTLTTTADVTAAPTDQVTARIVRAAAQVLADHPQLNAARDGDNFVPAETTHIAVAVQTDEGLVAPVVRDAAARPLEEVAGDIADLAERARSRGLAAADFEGATFTVTNLGAYGIDAFTPIINPPQIAILGVGAIRTVAGIDEDGAVAPRRQLTLSLTFDHAFVDGAPAAAFLAQLRDVLESG